MSDIESALTEPEKQIAKLRMELRRAYRALHGLYICFARGEQPDKSILAYHSLTIAAASCFVNEDKLDGSEFFEGKSIDDLLPGSDCEPSKQRGGPR